MLLDRFVRFLATPVPTSSSQCSKSWPGKIDAGRDGLHRTGDRHRPGPDRSGQQPRLKPIETEADSVCQRRLYEEIDRTFVTPIDREDLAQLTKALDNVIDGMEHTAAFAALFRFSALTDPMRHLVRLTVSCARELAGAARRLRAVRRPRLRSGRDHRRSQPGERGRRGLSQGHRGPLRQRRAPRRVGSPEGYAVQPGRRHRPVRRRDGRYPVGGGEEWVVLHWRSLVLVVVLALAFDYINGFHDTANAIATVVSTNVLPGRTAVILAAVCNFVGAFVGVGVACKRSAATSPIPDRFPNRSSRPLCSALPSSGTSSPGTSVSPPVRRTPSSADWSGAVWCFRVVQGRRRRRAAVGGCSPRRVLHPRRSRRLVLSPLCGLLGGFLLMVALLWLVRRCAPLRP